MKFRNSLAVVALLSCVAGSVFAGPRPAFERFVDTIARKTNNSPENVRESIVETLRQSKNSKFSEVEIERIRRGEMAEFSPAREATLVKYLQSSAPFRVRAGLDSLRLNAVESKGSEAFAAISKAEHANEIKQLMTRLKMVRVSIEINQAKTSAMMQKGMSAELVRKETAEYRALKEKLEAMSDELYFLVSSHLKISKIPFKTKVIEDKVYIDFELGELPPKLAMEAYYAMGNYKRLDGIQINFRALYDRNSVNPNTRSLELGMPFIRELIK